MRQRKSSKRLCNHKAKFKYYFNPTFHIKTLKLIACGYNALYIIIYKTRNIFKKDNQLIFTKYLRLL